MPTQDEYEEILSFIQSLPDENDTQDKFQPLWRRYRVDGEAITQLTDMMSNKILQDMNTFIRVNKKKISRASLEEDIEKAMEELDGIDPVRFLKMAIMTGLLQIFAYGSEYQQRWVLPDLVQECSSLSDDLDKLLGGGDE